MAAGTNNHTISLFIVDFASTADLDINSVLVTRREQLRFIEDVVQTAQLEKNQLLSSLEVKEEHYLSFPGTWIDSYHRIQEIKDTIEKRFYFKNEIDEQNRIIDSFNDSLDEYLAFRRRIQDEVKVRRERKRELSSI